MSNTTQPSDYKDKTSPVKIKSVAGALIEYSKNTNADYDKIREESWKQSYQ